MDTKQKLLNVDKSKIKTELQKWDERIIYKNPIKFKQEGDFVPLDKIYQRSSESFVMISLQKEITTYKTMRYFIENHALRNDGITFLDGRQISSFLDEGSEQWRIKQGINEFIELFGHQFANKWIIIPNLNNIKFDLKIAIYFVNKIKQTGAIGMVFHDEEDTTRRDLGSIIAENYVFQKDFLEFPYRDRKIRLRTLPEDGL